MATSTDILKQYWGYDSFRSIQEDIINSILAGKDTLGLMPTGGGKSICFQVPTLMMDGINIVVTPLIALMKDQVEHLRMLGIKAEAIYSGMMQRDIDRAYDNCLYGNYKFLYISPERLASEQFRTRLTQFRHICMITVDEAHCVSQWGYDFRPPYLKIAEARKLIRYQVPILALTATATPTVVEDIQQRLGFKQKNVFSMSFERKNLVYVVRKTIDKDEEMLKILQGVPGSAIVYTRSRRLTSTIAQLLNSKGITADNYHAGLTDAEKDFRQANWTKGRNRVMVATNAFGMGIDKPDVRAVIHYNVPDSLEEYYQEAGRAGRDGNTAYAVMLFDKHDNKVLHQRIADTYPDKDYIRLVYEDMCYFLQVGVGEAEGRTFDFSLNKFCTIFRHFPVLANSALCILSNAGYINYQMDNDFKSRIKINLRKEELYLLDNNNREMDTLVRTILQTYPGLFADFVYLDEMFLSHKTGMTADHIYDMLTDLSRRFVIEYIPRRTTPTITFTTRRVDTDRIALTDMVYETRKREYTKRIDHILNYANTDHICRSRLLLNYFGEEQKEDCGRCDVCLSLKKQTKDDRKAQNNVAAQIREQIIALLSDGKPHLASEVKQVKGQIKTVGEVLQTMIGEEEILPDGLYIKLNK